MPRVWGESPSPTEMLKNLEMQGMPRGQGKGKEKKNKQPGAGEGGGGRHGVEGKRVAWRNTSKTGKDSREAGC